MRLQLADFHAAFEKFFHAEQKRHELLQRQAQFFSVGSLEALQQWLIENESQLRTLPEIVVRHLARWADFFGMKDGQSASGANLSPRLRPSVRAYQDWIQDITIAPVHTLTEKSETLCALLRSRPQASGRRDIPSIG